MAPPNARARPPQPRLTCPERYAALPADASVGRLGAREATACRGRGVLVQAQRVVDRVGVRLGLGGLHGGEALGRELAGVLVLDRLQPRGALGLLGLVDG